MTHQKCNQTRLESWRGRSKKKRHKYHKIPIKAIFLQSAYFPQLPGKSQVQGSKEEQRQEK